MPHLPQTRLSRQNIYDFRQPSNFEYNSNSMNHPCKDENSDDTRSKNDLGLLNESDDGQQSNRGSRRWKANPNCSCADMKKGLEDMRGHLHRLESSMRDDVKLIIGLLRSKNNNNKPSSLERNVHIDPDIQANRTNSRLSFGWDSYNDSIFIESDTDNIGSTVLLDDKSDTRV